MTKEIQLEYNVQNALLYVAFFLGGPITLLWDWLAPEANGLGAVGGRVEGASVSFVPKLRPVCGVAGAELAFEGMGEGYRLWVG